MWYVCAYSRWRTALATPGAEARHEREVLACGVHGELLRAIVCVRLVLLRLIRRRRPAV